jgi:ParB-like chromosome segregation protein Spo0J
MPRREGLREIPLIVTDLTDKQMLQYMGRENGEDYNSDFLVMLNTWEEAAEFYREIRQNLKPLEIAQLLG